MIWNTLGSTLIFCCAIPAIKQDFRDCKHLLGVAELRCHWLVDYSWEAIAYISQGMHLYANNAYVTLFGFESMAEVRSMPVSHLVDTPERKTFEAMSKAADVGSKPSNRLLTTLRTLDGERMRAEIRFIPAVLKGQALHPVACAPAGTQLLKVCRYANRITRGKPRHSGFRNPPRRAPRQSRHPQQYPQPPAKAAPVLCHRRLLG